MSIRIEAATTSVQGFRFSGIAAGIKANGKPDLALAVADERAAVGGVFTRNIVKAAPVLIATDCVRRGAVRAVLANSGCANACTGLLGDQAARSVAAELGTALSIGAEEVLPASTGVIGAPLPHLTIAKRIPELVAGLSKDGADRFAQAILTTDRGPKVARATLTIEGRPCTVLGMAKGAGMIHPDLVPHATMLCFLFTDAAARGPALTRALTRVADATFNQASVDGDTSTNDTLVALASGVSAASPTTADEEIPGALEEAFLGVCEKIARDMVADGEGSEHLVELHVAGVGNAEAARAIAKTIATSMLVKTAIFGKDPNWGRILGAAGRAGVAFDPAAARILVGGVPIVENGSGCGREAEAQAKAIMKGPSYRIDVVLGTGPGAARYLMCDLGMGYVRCNADYRS